VRGCSIPVKESRFRDKVCYDDKPEICNANYYESASHIIHYIVSGPLVPTVFRVRSVGRSVSPSVGNARVNFGVMAQSIEKPFRVVAGLVGPRNGVLDGRAHWHHLANTVERLRAAAEWIATGGGDAASS